MSCLPFTLQRVGGSTESGGARPSGGGRVNARAGKSLICRSKRKKEKNKQINHRVCDKLIVINHIFNQISIFELVSWEVTRYKYFVTVLFPRSLSFIQVFLLPTTSFQLLLSNR